MPNNLLHNTWTVLKVILARARFLAVFAAAALVVGYWDDIKNHVDKWTRPPLAPDALAAASVSEVEYYCVMHPTVIRDHPGECPICGMPLAKRKKGEQVQLPPDVLARVQLTPQRIALANIQTSPVQLRPLVREIRTVGVLDYNESNVAKLAARVSGRADELFVRYTGQTVKAGDPVYSLYSPDVYTAQREYLFARKRVNDLPKDAPDDIRHDAVEVYNASMQKLVLWGTTAGQIEALEKEFDSTGNVPTHFQVTSPISGIVVRKTIYEGAYLQAGDTPFTIADLSTLWLQVQIFEQDIPLVKLGQAVEIQVEGRPTEIFRGAITFLAFQLDPATRTLAARVQVENDHGALKPGMFADALVRIPIGAAESPATAPGSQPAALSPGAVAARAFGDALQPYFAVQKLLATDKTENASVLLHDMLSRLSPLKADPAFANAVNTITPFVHAAMSQSLDDFRESFRLISAEMIALGRAIGTPPDGPTVRVFHCPMGKQPNWLQVGTETVNPFMGTKMVTCGAAIETLPRSPEFFATSTPPSGPAVLAIPRSAVIDTGRRTVVFAADPAMAGVYNMRQVLLGPRAGDYYPVLSGLQSGDSVVTNGAFLLDSENRLNPTPTAPPPTTTEPASQAIAPTPPTAPPPGHDQSH